MQKIDTIELLLSQIGYVRKTDTVGYHVTLSRNISTFKHYLKPKDSMDKFINAFSDPNEASESGEGVLTAKRIYTSDAFLTHSVQYGESISTIDMPYRVKDGITHFLASDISEYQSKASSAAGGKSSWLVRMLGLDPKRDNDLTNFRRHDLFNNEDGYIRFLEMYTQKCVKIVSGNSGAAKRFAILMEMSNFTQYESLALIAVDTTDEDLRLFLNFIQANAELEIVINDFKHAYNVFSMVGKNNFLD